MKMKYKVFCAFLATIVTVNALPLGHLGMGVTTKEDAAGEGYLLFNPGGIGDDRPSHPNSSNNFLAVFHNENGWFYYKNEGIVSFIPKRDDVLVASVNYTADTVTLLNGDRGLVHGIESGYQSGDLIITPNRYNGGSSPGEFEVSGTHINLYEDPRWDLEGVLGAGVTAKEEAAGVGYILYNPHGLGAERPYWNGASSHFLAVYFKEGAWYYYNNEESSVFTPQKDDVLIAEVDFTANTANLLKGEASIYKGIFTGYASGDINISPDRYGGGANPEEFELSGTFIRLNQCPHWWGQKDIIIEGVDNVDHFNMATVGQAKWMVKGAIETIQEVSPALANSILENLVGNDPAIHAFSGWPPPVSVGQDFNVLLLGQLKSITGPIYQALNDTVPDWLENEMLINKTRQAGTFYPWGNDVGAVDNFATTNLGQLKALFTLRFSDLVNHIDTDGDGLVDGFELAIINADPNDALITFADVKPNDDFDNDFFTNLEEANAGKDPVSPEGGFTWQDVQWRGFDKTELVVSEFPGGALTKPSGTGWNAGAYSEKMMQGDGAILFQFDQSNKYLMCGLSEANTSSGYGELKYAVYARNDGGIQIRENGHHLRDAGSYSKTDRFEIRRVGATVTYYKNGNVLYQSTVTTNKPLFVDATIHSESAILTRCGHRGFADLDTDQDGLPDAWESQLVAASTELNSISQVIPSDDLDGDYRANVIEYLNGQNALVAEESDFTDVQWKSLVGVESGQTPGIPGVSLARTSRTGVWNADAISSSILSGDGEVRFRFSKNTEAVMCVLRLVSSGNSSRSFQEIDYAIYARKDGVIRIFEKGQDLDVKGYSYGGFDDFAVRRVGDTISYLKNGEQFYASTVKTTEALEIDTSFRDIGGSIYGVGKKGFGFDLTDSDDDGIADGWEQFYFGDLTTADSNSDFDNDGIKDLFEYLAGTDPKIDEVNGPSNHVNRKNYLYDELGRIDSIKGVQNVDYLFDKEGNMLEAK